jgi:CheY-like chemotaxis protein
MEGRGRRRVLIADDDAAFRQALREYFEQSGYTALEAANGVETLWTIKHRRCAAVILDLRMPRLGGLETLPQIQRFDPSIAIIVVTAHATDEVLAELAMIGVPVLTKPIDLPALGALVAGVDAASSPGTIHSRLTKG